MSIRKKAIKPIAKPQKGIAKKIQGKSLAATKLVNLKPTAFPVDPCLT
jgi:hypothetical protein